MKLLDVAAAPPASARGLSGGKGDDGGKGFLETLGAETGTAPRASIRTLLREAGLIDEKRGPADDLSMPDIDGLDLAGPMPQAESRTPRKLLADDDRPPLQPAKQPRIDWLAIRPATTEKSEPAATDQAVADEAVAELVADARIPVETGALGADLAPAAAAAQMNLPREKADAEKMRTGEKPQAVTAIGAEPAEPQPETDRRVMGFASLTNREPADPATPRSAVRAEGSAPAPQVQVLSSQQAPAVPAGPAFDGPASTVVAAISEEAPAIARSVAASHLAVPGHEPMRMLKIQLHPQELGVVTAKLRMSGGEMSVELDVETAEARSKLAADANEIVKALRGIGIEVERVTVIQSTAPQSQVEPHMPDRGANRAGSDAAGSERGRDGSNGQAGQGNGTFGGERHARDEAARGGGVYI